MNFGLNIYAKAIDWICPEKITAFIDAITLIPIPAKY
jgi:hypothetical protein